MKCRWVVASIQPWQDPPLDFLFCVQDPPNPMHKDTESKITIVDLAGSERQSKTDITNAVQAAEAERINMSLLILGRCLSASSGSGKQHIPVRESVLTKYVHVFVSTG